jgi:hypothetical protein
MLRTEKQMQGKNFEYVRMQEKFFETTSNRRFICRLKENLKTLLHVIQVILHLAIESDVDRKQC